MLLNNLAFAQEGFGPTLGIKSFAIFGGDNNTVLTDSVQFGVDLGSNVSVQGGGSIGSYGYVQVNNQVNIAGSIYSNIFTAGNSVSVKGSISVFNNLGSSSNVLRMGALANTNTPGNIFLGGNGLIVSGNVDGTVQHGYYYTYTGPTPGGGEDPSFPTFPILPAMPYTNYEFGTGNVNINSTQAILPGRYNAVFLSGGKTLTFSGVGDYYFKTMVNGGANNFVFDFKNAQTGVFKIFVEDTADLANLTSSVINGGNAGRIYYEVQGVGNVPEKVAFRLNTTNQTSGSWNGTIWAPNGAIEIGERATGSITVINGCLWSGTKVKTGINVNMNYVPALYPSANSPYSNIVPYYPPPATGKTTTLIGSELTSLYENFAAIGNDSIIYRVFGNKVLIEVIALKGQYAATKTFLLANGLTDTVPNGPGSLIITGKFPIANLLVLNTRRDLIDYVRPLFWPILNSGLVQGSGDSAMQSHFVRGGYDIDGTGVKVGVMSDSYNSIPGDHAAIDVANGDLPGPGNPENHLTVMQLVKEYPYGESIDEGRAMLQIVHDVAPGASLAFRTGFISAGDFALGIGQLKTAGCKVIVDDITFITEPYYTDGVIAKAVNQAVIGGSSYFTAAGNFGKKSYEATFTGMPAPTSLLSSIPGEVHDFGSGNPFQTLDLDPGNYTMVLQWDEDIYSLGGPSTGTQSDLDIYLVDEFGSTLFGFNRNNVGTDPLEVLPFTVTSATQARILISRAAGSNPNLHFKYIVFRGPLTSIDGHPDGASTIVGQANADSAITIGAVLYQNTPLYGVNPPTAASFSSHGGTTIKGEAVPRQKPEFTAPNGVNTTVDFHSYELEGDRFPNFYGTSAAAPHAAAAAALLFQGQQKYLGHIMTRYELKQLLKNTAAEMGPVAGYDTSSGFGFIQPFAAMQTFAAPKPEITALETANPIVSPVSTPFRVTVKGKFLTSQTQVLFGDIALPTTFINTETVSAEIPSFSGDPAVQLKNPPITNNDDGGTSDSYYFSSPVKKHVKVKAEDKTIKYGEILPAFTSIITVDDIPVTDGPTLTTLKLNNLIYSSPATSTSNVALYFIEPKMATPLATNDPLLKQYIFEFDKGVLTIDKLPLTITPLTTTLTYGNRIHNINFNYQLDPSANLANRTGLTSSLNTLHAAAIADSLIGILNGSGATSRALVNSDLEDLGILISNGSGATSRALVNNGSGTTETSYVIDIDTSAIVNYVDYYYLDPTIGNGSGATSRALVNTGPLVNGTARVTLQNGSGATSRALVNGDASLTNSTGGNGSRTNVAVVVSVADLDSPGIRTRSVNMVTGIKAGTHSLVPGALLSGNFETLYSPGDLIINKAALNVKANTAYSNDGKLPLPFTSSINYQYQDATLRVSGPLYTLIPNPANPLKVPAGVYVIRPSALMLSDFSNYTGPNYVDGLLYVNPYGSGAKKITLSLKCVELLRTPVNGYKYIAHFVYNNYNSTPVYVPVGVDNKITISAPYQGIQPIVFEVGSHVVDYYFNGQKLTWSIRTNDGVSKKTVSEITATSSSTKCKTVSTQTITKNDETLMLENPVTKGTMMLYPNPAANKLVIANIDLKKEKTIMVLDAQGRSYAVKVTGRAGQKIELDIATLEKGVYFIKLKNDSSKPLSFIKL